MPGPNGFMTDFLGRRLVRLVDADMRLSILDDFVYSRQHCREAYQPLLAWLHLSVMMWAVLLPLYSQRLGGGIAMIKNYLLIALRNLRRHKTYSIINIAGLAVGLLCGLLIFLWVQDELSYDRYNRHHERIVRVTRRWLNEDGAVSLHLGHVAPPIGPLLKNDFDEIAYGIRMYGGGRMLVSHDGRQFPEGNFYFAEKDLFNIFSFDLKSGDAQHCLEAPGSVVITEAMAEKYFGSDNPLGQTLTMDFGSEQGDFTVSGVMEAMPEQSHFHADFFASFKTLEMVVGPSEMENWGSNNYGTYLLLKPGVSMDSFQALMGPFLERHYGEGTSMRTELVLQHLADIHLHSNLDSEYEANGDYNHVIVFSAIALFIILIACINFMNLATARSASRALEIGLRKTMGAERGQIIRQFLNEAVVMALLALLIAVLLLVLILPVFNNFIGKSLSAALLLEPFHMLLLIGLALTVGLVSGSYPAFLLSAMKPAGVMKMQKNRQSPLSLRSLLVVFQLTISVALMIGVGAVSHQLNFMQNKSLGINKEHVVILPSSDYISGHAASVKAQLLAYPGVEGVSLAKRIPSGRLLDSGGAKAFVDGVETPVDFRIASLRVDHDYLPVFKMKLLAGRNFSVEMPTDSTEAFVLNAVAISRMGYDSPEAAIGEPFVYGSRRGRIIGVVDNFHFESLHKTIAPMVFMISDHSLNRVSVRISPDDQAATLAFLKEKWAVWNAGYPFNFQFLDDRLANLYRSEQKLNTLFNVFASLSIFISCMGLLGLASHTVAQRTREIGVRKVLGASGSGLFLLLVGEMLRWIAIANIIAWPLAWRLMSRWLEGFAYRYQMDVWLFARAGLWVLAVAVITVAWQTNRAVQANPVDALKYE